MLNQLTYVEKYKRIIDKQLIIMYNLVIFWHDLIIMLYSENNIGLGTGVLNC